MSIKKTISALFISLFFLSACGLVEKGSMDLSNYYLSEKKQEKLPPKNPEIVLNEKFNNNVNGWKEFAGTGYLGRILNGKYVLQTRNNNDWTKFRNLPVVVTTKLDPRYDFEATLSVTSHYSSVRGFWGFIFGYVDKENYNMFALKPDGRFQVTSVNNGKVKVYANWDKSDAIKQGNNYKVKIKKDKNVIYYVVNGIEVYKKRNIEVKSGNIGFTSSGVTYALIDSILLNGVKTSQEREMQTYNSDNKIFDICTGKIDEEGFVTCGSIALYDVRSGLIWLDRSTKLLNFLLYKGVVHPSGPSSANSIKKYQTYLNNIAMSGINNWRIPTSVEYFFLLSTNGKKCLSKTSGYYYIPSSFNACPNRNVQYFLTKDLKGYDLTRKRKVGNTKVSGFYPVADYYIDYIKTSKVLDKKLPKEQQEYLDDTFSLFKIGSYLKSFKKLDSFFKENRDSTFEYELWHDIMDNKFPLQFATLPFVYNPSHQNTEFFNYQYAHIANLAANPVALILVSDKFAYLAENESSQQKSKEYENASYFFKALARAYEQNFQEAYNILLLETDFSDNHYIYSYINKYCSVLLKDKKKLAISLKVPQSYFIVNYRPPKPQTLFNPYTGNIIEPSISAPKTKQKPSGATILD